MAEALRDVEFRLGVDARQMMSGFNKTQNQFTNMSKSMTNNMKSVSSHSKKSATTMKNAFSNSFSGIEKTMHQTFTVAMGNIISNFVQSSINKLKMFWGKADDMAEEYERVLLGVRKTSGLTEQQTQSLRHELLMLSSETLPISAAALGRTADVAAHLGIQFKNMASFTEEVSKAALALPEFAGGAEEVADSMGKMLNIYGIVGEEIPSKLREFMTVMDQLSNNAATDAKKISEFMATFTEANRLGLAQHEVAALGATLTALGKQANAAGTQIQTAFINMTTSGLDNIEKLLARSGQSMEEWKETFTSDKMKGLKVILDTVSAIDDEFEQSGYLKDIFGKIGLKGVGSLMNNWKLLEKHIGIAGDEAKRARGELLDQNIAIEREVEILKESSWYSVNQLRMAWDALRLSLGNKVLPTMGALSQMTLPWLNELTRWLEAVSFDKISMSISSVTEGISALITGFANIAKTIGIVDKGASKLSWFLNAVVQSMFDWTQRLGSFVSSFKKIFDSINNYLRSSTFGEQLFLTFERLRQSIQPAIASIGQFIEVIFVKINKIISFISGTLMSVWEGFWTGFSNNSSSFLDTVSEIWNALVQTKDIVLFIFSTVGKSLQKIGIELNIFKKAFNLGLFFGKIFRVAVEYVKKIIHIFTVIPEWMNNNRSVIITFGDDIISIFTKIFTTLKNTWDSVVSSLNIHIDVMAIFKNTLSLLSNVFAKVSKHMVIFWDIAKGTFSTITKDIKVLLPHIKAILFLFGGFTRKLLGLEEVEFASDPTKMLSSSLSNVSSKLISYSQDMGKAFIPFIAGTKEAEKTLVHFGDTAYGHSILPETQTHISLITSKIFEMGYAFGTYAIDKIKQFGSVMVNIGKNTLSILKQIGVGVGLLFINLVIPHEYQNKVKQNLLAIGTNIKTFFSGIFTLITTSTGSVLSSVVPIIQKTVGYIFTFITDHLRRVTTLISQVPQLLTDAFSSMGSFFSEYGVELYKTLKVIGEALDYWFSEGIILVMKGIVNTFIMLLGVIIEMPQVIASIASKLGLIVEGSKPIKLLGEAIKSIVDIFKSWRRSFEIFTNVLIKGKYEIVEYESRVDSLILMFSRWGKIILDLRKLTLWKGLIVPPPNTLLEAFNRYSSGLDEGGEVSTRFSQLVGEVNFQFSKLQKGIKNTNTIFGKFIGAFRAEGISRWTGEFKKAQVAIGQTPGQIENSIRKIKDYQKSIKGLDSVRFTWRYISEEILTGIDNLSERNKMLASGEGPFKRMSEVVKAGEQSRILRNLQLMKILKSVISIIDKTRLSVVALFKASKTLTTSWINIGKASDLGVGRVQYIIQTTREVLGELFGDLWKISDIGPKISSRLHKSFYPVIDSFKNLRKHTKLFGKSLLSLRDNWLSLDDIFVADKVDEIAKILDPFDDVIEGKLIVPLRKRIAELFTTKLWSNIYQKTLGRFLSSLGKIGGLTSKLFSKIPGISKLNRGFLRLTNVTTTLNKTLANLIFTNKPSIMSKAWNSSIILMFRSFARFVFDIEKGIISLVLSFKPLSKAIKTITYLYRVSFGSAIKILSIDIKNLVVSFKNFIALIPPVQGLVRFIGPVLQIFGNITASVQKLMYVFQDFTAMIQSLAQADFVSFGENITKVILRIKLSFAKFGIELFRDVLLLVDNILFTIAGPKIATSLQEMIAKIRTNLHKAIEWLTWFGKQIDVKINMIAGIIKDTLTFMFGVISGEITQFHGPWENFIAFIGKSINIISNILKSMYALFTGQSLIGRFLGTEEEMIAGIDKTLSGTITTILDILTVGFISALQLIVTQGMAILKGFGEYLQGAFHLRYNPFESLGTMMYAAMDIVQLAFKTGIELMWKNWPTVGDIIWMVTNPWAVAIRGIKEIALLGFRSWLGEESPIYKWISTVSNFIIDHITTPFSRIKADIDYIGTKVGLFDKEPTKEAGTNVETSTGLEGKSYKEVSKMMIEMQNSYVSLAAQLKSKTVQKELIEQGIDITEYKKNISDSIQQVQALRKELNTSGLADGFVDSFTKMSISMKQADLEKVLTTVSISDPSLKKTVDILDTIDTRYGHLIKSNIKLSETYDNVKQRLVGAMDGALDPINSVAVELQSLSKETEYLFESIGEVNFTNTLRGIRDLDPNMTPLVNALIQIDSQYDKLEQKNSGLAKDFSLLKSSLVETMLLAKNPISDVAGELTNTQEETINLIKKIEKLGILAYGRSVFPDMLKWSSLVSNGMEILGVSVLSIRDSLIPVGEQSTKSLGSLGREIEVGSKLLSYILIQFDKLSGQTLTIQKIGKALLQTSQNIRAIPQNLSTFTSSIKNFGSGISNIIGGTRDLLISWRTVDERANSIISTIQKGSRKMSRLFLSRKELTQTQTAKYIKKLETLIKQDDTGKALISLTKAAESEGGMFQELLERLAGQGREDLVKNLKGLAAERLGVQIKPDIADNAILSLRQKFLNIFKIGERGDQFTKSLERIKIGLRSTFRLEEEINWLSRLGEKLRNTRPVEWASNWMEARKAVQLGLQESGQYIGFWQKNFPVMIKRLSLFTQRFSEMKSPFKSVIGYIDGIVGRIKLMRVPSAFGKTFGVLGKVFGKILQFLAPIQKLIEGIFKGDFIKGFGDAASELYIFIPVVGQITGLIEGASYLIRDLSGVLDNYLMKWEGSPWADTLRDVLQLLSQLSDMVITVFSGLKNVFSTVVQSVLKIGVAMFKGNWENIAQIWWNGALKIGAQLKDMFSLLWEKINKLALEWFSWKKMAGIADFVWKIMNPFTFVIKAITEMFKYAAKKWFGEESWIYKTVKWLGDNIVKWITDPISKSFQMIQKANQIIRGDESGKDKTRMTNIEGTRSELSRIDKDLLKEEQKRNVDSKKLSILRNKRIYLESKLHELEQQHKKSKEQEIIDLERFKSPVDIVSKQKNIISDSLQLPEKQYAVKTDAQVIYDIASEQIRSKYTKEVMLAVKDTDVATDDKNKAIITDIVEQKVEKELASQGVFKGTEQKELDVEYRKALYSTAKQTEKFTNETFGVWKTAWEVPTQDTGWFAKVKSMVGLGKQEKKEPSLQLYGGQTIESLIIDRQEQTEKLLKSWLKGHEEVLAKSFNSVNESLINHTQRMSGLIGQIQRTGEQQIVVEDPTKGIAELDKYLSNGITLMRVGKNSQEQALLNLKQQKETMQTQLDITKTLSERNVGLSPENLQQRVQQLSVVETSITNVTKQLLDLNNTASQEFLNVIKTFSDQDMMNKHLVPALKQAGADVHLVLRDITGASAEELADNFEQVVSNAFDLDLGRVLGAFGTTIESLGKEQASILEQDLGINVSKMGDLFSSLGTDFTTYRNGMNALTFAVKGMANETGVEFEKLVEVYANGGKNLETQFGLTQEAVLSQASILAKDYSKHLDEYDDSTRHQLGQVKYNIEESLELVNSAYINMYGVGLEDTRDYLSKRFNLVESSLRKLDDAQYEHLSEQELIDSALIDHSDDVFNILIGTMQEQFLAHKDLIRKREDLDRKKALAYNAGSKEEVIALDAKIQSIKNTAKQIEAVWTNEAVLIFGKKESEAMEILGVHYDELATRQERFLKLQTEFKDIYTVPELEKTKPSDSKITEKREIIYKATLEGFDKVQTNLTSVLTSSHTGSKEISASIRDIYLNSGDAMRQIFNESTQILSMSKGEVQRYASAFKKAYDLNGISVEELSEKMMSLSESMRTSLTPSGIESGLSYVGRVLDHQLEVQNRKITESMTEWGGTDSMKPILDSQIRLSKESFLQIEDTLGKAIAQYELKGDDFLNVHQSILDRSVPQVDEIFNFIKDVAKLPETALEIEFMGMKNKLDEWEQNYNITRDDITRVIGVIQQGVVTDIDTTVSKMMSDLNISVIDVYDNIEKSSAMFETIAGGYSTIVEKYGHDSKEVSQYTQAIYRNSSDDLFNLLKSITGSLTAEGKVIESVLLDNAKAFGVSSKQEIEGMRKLAEEYAKSVENVHNMNEEFFKNSVITAKHALEDLKDTTKFGEIAGIQWSQFDDSIKTAFRAAQLAIDLETRELDVSELGSRMSTLFERGVIDQEQMNFVINRMKDLSKAGLLEINNFVEGGSLDFSARSSEIIKRTYGNVLTDTKSSLQAITEALLQGSSTFGAHTTDMALHAQSMYKQMTSNQKAMFDETKESLNKYKGNTEQVSKLIADQYNIPLEQAKKLTEGVAAATREWKEETKGVAENLNNLPKIELASEMKDMVEFGLLGDFSDYNIEYKAKGGIVGKDKKKGAPQLTTVNEKGQEGFAYGGKVFAIPGGKHTRMLAAGGEVIPHDQFTLSLDDILKKEKSLTTIPQSISELVNTFDFVDTARKNILDTYYPTAPPAYDDINRINEYAYSLAEEYHKKLPQDLQNSGYFLKAAKEIRDRRDIYNYDRYKSDMSQEQFEKWAKERDVEHVAAFNEQGLIGSTTRGLVNTAGSMSSLIQEGLKSTVHNHPLDIPFSRSDLEKASELGEKISSFESTNVITSAGRKFSMSGTEWPSVATLGSLYEKYNQNISDRLGQMYKGDEDESQYSRVAAHAELMNRKIAGATGLNYTSYDGYLEPLGNIYDFAKKSYGRAISEDEMDIDPTKFVSESQYGVETIMKQIAQFEQKDKSSWLPKAKVNILGGQTGKGKDIVSLARGGMLNDAVVNEREGNTGFETVKDTKGVLGKAGTTYPTIATGKYKGISGQGKGGSAGTLTPNGIVKGLPMGGYVYPAHHTTSRDMQAHFAKVGGLVPHFEHGGYGKQAAMSAEDRLWKFHDEMKTLDQTKDKARYDQLQILIQQAELDLAKERGWNYQQRKKPVGDIKTGTIPSYNKTSVNTWDKSGIYRYDTGKKRDGKSVYEYTNNKGAADRLGLEKVERSQGNIAIASGDAALKRQNAFVQKYEQIRLGKLGLDQYINGQFDNPDFGWRIIDSAKRLLPKNYGNIEKTTTALAKKYKKIKQGFSFVKWENNKEEIAKLLSIAMRNKVLTGSSLSPYSGGTSQQGYTSQYNPMMALEAGGLLPFLANGGGYAQTQHDWYNPYKDNKRKPQYEAPEHGKQVYTYEGAEGTVYTTDQKAKDRYGAKKFEGTTKGYVKGHDNAKLKAKRVEQEKKFKKQGAGKGTLRSILPTNINVSDFIVKAKEALEKSNADTDRTVTTLQTQYKYKKEGFKMLPWTREESTPVLQTGVKIVKMTDFNEGKGIKRGKALKIIKEDSIERMKKIADTKLGVFGGFYSAMKGGFIPSFQDGGVVENKETANDLMEKLIGPAEGMSNIDLPENQFEDKGNIYKIGHNTAVTLLQGMEDKIAYFNEMKNQAEAVDVGLIGGVTMGTQAEQESIKETVTKSDSGFKESMDQIFKMSKEDIKAKIGQSPETAVALLAELREKYSNANKTITPEGQQVRDTISKSIQKVKQVAKNVFGGDWAKYAKLKGKESKKKMKEEQSAMKKQISEYVSGGSGGAKASFARFKIGGFVPKEEEMVLEPGDKNRTGLVSRPNNQLARWMTPMGNMSDMQSPAGLQEYPRISGKREKTSGIQEYPRSPGKMQETVDSSKFGGLSKMGEKSLLKWQQQNMMMPSMNQRPLSSIRSMDRIPNSLYEPVTQTINKLAQQEELTSDQSKQIFAGIGVQYNNVLENALRAKKAFGEHYASAKNLKNNYSSGGFITPENQKVLTRSGGGNVTMNSDVKFYIDGGKVHDVQQIGSIVDKKMNDRDRKLRNRVSNNGPIGY